MSSFVVVVPARLHSTRLPEKMLADIGGQPMLIRVLARAAKSGANRVVAAVDCDALYDAVCQAGSEVVLTGQHDSGSGRVARAVDLLNFADETIVVNVQGDEPFIEPKIIAEVAALLAARDDCVCATACRRLRDTSEYADSSAVKVVATSDQTASYFSRASVPYQRDGGNAPPSEARIHVGIYACRAAYWRKLPALPAAPLEEVERLEQLRILWNGDKIALLDCQTDSFGIDTPADLAYARRHFFLDRL